jgi:hypothetical protein
MTTNAERIARLELTGLDTLAGSDYWAISEDVAALIEEYEDQRRKRDAAEDTTAMILLSLRTGAEILPSVMVGYNRANTTITRTQDARGYVHLRALTTTPEKPEGENHA